jgi:hypothetical protein
VPGIEDERQISIPRLPREAGERVFHVPVCRELAQGQMLDEEQLVVIGMAIDKKSGSPIALLAEDADDGLRFAGDAFIAFKSRMRERFGEKLARLAAERPATRRTFRA